MREERYLLKAPQASLSKDMTVMSLSRGGIFCLFFVANDKKQFESQAKRDVEFVSP
jgi:hypothetical protein